jgi:hypothetical protein
MDKYGEEKKCETIGGRIAGNFRPVPNPWGKVSKKAQKAYLLANQSNLAQWRCRIRHPRFRKELGQLQRECKGEKDRITAHQRINQLFNKWDLPRLTPNLLMNLPPID